jgi:putative transposase
VIRASVDGESGAGFIDLLPWIRPGRRVGFPARSKEGGLITKKRIGEELIFRILSGAHAGATAIEVFRRHEISAGTFYRWKAKHGRMPVGDVKRLKDFEVANAQPKRLLAETCPDNAALARISHQGRCIGPGNLEKWFCENDLPDPTAGSDADRVYLRTVRFRRV